MAFLTGLIARENEYAWQEIDNLKKITANRLPFWKESFRQFFKYGIVGVVNTLITLAAIFILMEFIGVHYVAANAVGYILGFINSFIMNKIWTFESKGNTSKEILSFVLIFLVSYAFQLLLLILIKEKIGISAEIAQVVAMIFYTIISFIGNKSFTFRKE